MRKSVKRQKPQPKPPVTEDLVRLQMAQASGSEAFQHRDPVYHVSESFQQTFDRIGLAHGAELAGGAEETAARTPEENAARTSEETAARTSEETAARTEDRAEPRDRQARPAGGDQTERQGLRNYPNTMIPLQRFSETAFQRGSLSASILAGTGKMMLVSCLKRTIGQSGPKRLQQQSLFDTGSQTRNIPNRDPDQMVFNRSFAGGAVGLVVDTLRDARRVVQSMEEMARGTGELKSSESGTLRAMYPFLDDSRERELVAQYEAQLSRAADERERAVLQNALVRTRALWNKKKQMKTEFINKLRLISDRATEAQAEFEAPGFVDEIAAAMTESEEAAAPLEEPPEEPSSPPEPPPDTGDSHDPDRPEDRQPEDGVGAEAPSGTETEAAGN